MFAQINAARLPGACPGGVGLTTALAILDNGWVVVGSLPTVAGNPATAKAGCLLVLNSNGRVVETFHGNGINGPWDMTSVSWRGISDLFVTNVLNGTVAAGGKQVHQGTVLRLTVTTPARGIAELLATTTIGSGFARGDQSRRRWSSGRPGSPWAGTGRCTWPTPSATGSPPSPTRCSGRTAPEPGRRSAGTAPSTARSAWPSPRAATSSPPTRSTATWWRSRRAARQVAVKMLDTSGSPAGAGALFGLAVAPGGHGVYFVDDATNTLDLLH